MLGMPPGGETTKLVKRGTAKGTLDQFCAALIKVTAVAVLAPKAASPVRKRCDVSSRPVKRLGSFRMKLGRMGLPSAERVAPALMPDQSAPLYCPFDMVSGEPGVTTIQ